MQSVTNDIKTFSGFAIITIFFQCLDKREPIIKIRLCIDAF